MLSVSYSVNFMFKHFAYRFQFADVQVWMTQRVNFQIELRYCNLHTQGEIAFNAARSLAKEVLLVPDLQLVWWAGWCSPLLPKEPSAPLPHTFAMRLNRIALFWSERFIRYLQVSKGRLCRLSTQMGMGGSTWCLEHPANWNVPLAGLCSDGFPHCGPDAKECLQCRRPGFDPWVRKTPWEGNGHSLQCSCLRIAVDRGAREWLTHSHTQLGTGFGNPLHSQPARGFKCSLHFCVIFSNNTLALQLHKLFPRSFLVLDLAVR